MKTCRFIAAAFVLCLSTSVYAQVLWNGIRHGSTLQELKRTFPRAKAMSGVQPLPSGDEELLRINSHTFVGKPFEVRFYFVRERLTSVSLAMEKWESNTDNLRTFDQISKQFRTQYGEPVENEFRHDKIMLSASRIWRSGEAEVRMSVIPVTAENSMFGIDYRKIERAQTKQTKAN